MNRWNILTAAALAAMVGGFFLGKGGSSLGRILLGLGCIAFAVSLVGSSRHSAKQPSRCPRCGGMLRFVGRRWPGMAGLSQRAICLDCGGTFAPEDLE